ncbi:MAG: transglutaminase family protein [Armatimonadetes bacterium]|nr:transglutaminase family protein [Armatimonadota bacterium]
MRLRVKHTTNYIYSQPVKEAHTEVRLLPHSDNAQTCLSFHLTTRPHANLFHYDLPSGRVHHFNIRPPHSEQSVTVESLVATHLKDPFSRLPLLDNDASFYTQPEVRQRYYEYLIATKRVPLLEEVDRFAEAVRANREGNTACFLTELTRHLHGVFVYTPGATTVHSRLEEFLEQREGVCQDFAHLLLAICRRQGIPARYASGYIYTGSASTIEEVSYHAEGPGLVGDGGMHAWVECLLPNGVWVGFDPTNDLVVNDHYIKVHYGRDYSDVTPVLGVYSGEVTNTLDVSVRVTYEGD